MNSQPTNRKPTILKPGVMEAVFGDRLAKPDDPIYSERPSVTFLHPTSRFSDATGTSSVPKSTRNSTASRKKKRKT